MSRAPWDVLFDNIVSRLEAYSAASPAGERFDVMPDSYRTIGSLDNGAHVLVYLGPLDPDSRSSAQGKSYHYSVQYYIDCIALGARQRKAAEDDVSSERAAGVRMRYLIEQVMKALWNPNDFSLGLATNWVGRRPPPSIEPLPPDMQRGERAIAGARVTMSVELTWEPVELTSTAIDQISVDAGRWSALYDYGE